MRGLIQKHWLLSLVIFTFILIVSNNLGWLPMGNVTRAALNPIAKGVTSVSSSFGNWFKELGKIGSLSEKNARLMEENNQLKQKLIESLLAKNEYDELVRQMGVNQELNLLTKEARIINYNPDKVRQFIRINAGKSAGVREGQPVLAGGNLLGIISRAEANYCDVMLITDGDFRVLAQTSTTTAPGIVKGLSSNRLAMERIPLDEKVDNGEIVITSGMDGVFPRGILIGEVLSVGESADAIFRTANIRPAVDLTNVRVVTIVVGRQ